MLCCITLTAKRKQQAPTWVPPTEEKTNDHPEGTPTPVAPSGDLNLQEPADHAPLVWAVLSFSGLPFPG